ncbi:MULTISPECIES: 6-phosphofructokinase [Streptobacillus]|uniref:ATP-dependent 6-phosphofructokinase n=1 Tax=Streptobacillus moniliformis (strain ATCC 14647 / DSM 12112 / NCTC 10651 / 9901) TaxID=519441 RepID=D1AX68_STRM9|nr:MULTISPECIES: 6-phosphofructokinase [Streptobacillus]ACZ00894.1 6-phosphofructokinase [Streptobacillus moniliformis DSM 12112]AVL42719.1 6-phosphofructokinase [Streptobacillus moniliformis]SQA13968.1 6-phosphofructokinase [Streptobacillus moniliformis]
MKKIAILTSGGDSQGMNTAIRVVAKTAMHKGIEVYGIRRGYKGILNRDIFKMSLLDVAGLAGKGGTMLLSARLPEFKDPEVRTRAANILKEFGIEGLVVIGGDGSFHGAHYLYEEHGIKTIGIPGTIDNDIAGTDYTIGYDTALNIILESFNQIRDTAKSHDRTFFIEVMGRNCGDLALNAGIAAGANGILIPEVETSIEDIINIIQKRREAGKFYDVIIMSEGYKNKENILKELKERMPELDVKHTALSHIQRGGNPTAADRLLATRLGVRAVELLLEGKSGLMVGIESSTVVTHKLSYAWENYHKKSQEDYDIAMMLSV